MIRIRPTLSSSEQNSPRAEGVADLVLADGAEPERRVRLHLGRRDQDRVVAGVDAGEGRHVSDIVQYIEESTGSNGALSRQS